MKNKNIKNKFLISILFLVLINRMTYGNINRNFTLNKNTFKIFYSEPENSKVFHYPNGNIKSEQFFLNNKKAGVWKFYYENGKIKSTATFNPYSQVEEATIVNYDERGVVISTGKIIDTTMMGLWKYYDEKGRLNYSFDYSSGTISLFNEKEELILKLKEDEIVEKLDKILREVENNDTIRDF